MLSSSGSSSGSNSNSAAVIVSPVEALEQADKGVINEQVYWSSYGVV
jgi:hypothetical protein